MVDDSDRIDLDQVAWGHRRYPDHYVCWLVICEQGCLGRFDDRHVFVALVIDDIDGDLADLLRPGAGSSKRTDLPAFFGPAILRERRPWRWLMNFAA